MAMIELYEAMRTLRAVRRLRPDPIPDDVLRRVLEAATWAPTGGNRQAWRVVVVKDPICKGRLGELYKRIAVPFMQSYSARLASLPESERAKTERMLRSGLYLAEHFGEVPGGLYLLFPSRWVGSDRRRSSPCIGSRRRIDLSSRAESIIGLPC
jgi:nitroreductase